MVRLSNFNPARSTRSEWTNLKKEVVNSYKINLFDLKDARVNKKMPMTVEKSKPTKKKIMPPPSTIPARNEDKRTKSAPKLRSYVNYLKRPDPNIISMDKIPVEFRQSLMRQKSKNTSMLSDEHVKPKSTVNKITPNSMNKLKRSSFNGTNTHVSKQSNGATNIVKNFTSSHTSSSKPKLHVKTIKEISKLHSLTKNKNFYATKDKDVTVNPANLKDLNTFTLKQPTIKKLSTPSKDEAINFITSNSAHKGVIDLNFNFSPIMNQTQEDLFTSTSPMIINLNSLNSMSNVKNRNFDTYASNPANSVLSGKVGFISNKYKGLIDQFLSS